MSTQIAGQYRTPVGAVTGTNNATIPILVDSSGRLVVVTSGGGGSGGTSSTFGAAWPTDGTAAGFYDGTNMQGARVFDADTGGGTQYVLGAIIRLSANGGSVEGGTSANPLRTDPTGTTTQPVSSTQLPSTLGAKASAASLSIVLASDQSAIPARISTGTYVGMTALAASKVIIGAAGTLYTAAGWLDSTLSTGTYYVQLIDSSAAVDSGGAITAIAIIKVSHTSGTDDYFDFSSYLPNGGIAVTNGAVVQLSSTLGTGTLAGSFLLAAGSKA